MACRMVRMVLPRAQSGIWRDLRNAVNDPGCAEQGQASRAHQQIRIINFANFADLQVETGENLVIVGENKVGKSNLIFALQLILDSGLAERDRLLGLEHFWDGLGDEKLGAVIEIALELTDFDDDPRLLAHLADAIVDPGPPMVARLT